MIKKHKKLQTITSILLIGFFVLSSTSAQSQVSSISAEDFAQYGTEAAYWVATVTCTDGSERKIQRKTDGNLWCGKDVSGYCRELKNEAADLVCGDSYSVVWQNQNSAAAEEAAQREAEERRRRQQAEQRRAEQRIANQEAQRREQQAAAAAASGPSPEQLSIEEELITIEQEKIELRKQELELRRRAVEIQALLDAKTGS